MGADTERQEPDWDYEVERKAFRRRIEQQLEEEGPEENTLYLY